MTKHITTEFRAVAEFIETQTGFPRDRIQVDTTLMDDVGLDEEDAEEFFVEFGKLFQVNLDALNLSLHFGGEGFWSWSPCATA